MRVTIFSNPGETPLSPVSTIRQGGNTGRPPREARNGREMEEWFEPSLCTDCEDLEDSCRHKRLVPCAAVVVRRQRLAERLQQELKPALKVLDSPEREQETLEDPEE